ncbi:hypothetical protein [Sphaerospermopsis torques-reginae]|nr:hypothetical protein [Sphaerospermopsis torques-reginae]
MLGSALAKLTEGIAVREFGGAIAGWKVWEVQSFFGTLIIESAI